MTLTGLFITLTPRPINFESRPMNVVWNIGQGQWFTEVTANRCTHFDAGGEYSALNSVTKICGTKTNQLFLSHWDWDHLSFVGSLARRLPGICLVNQPPGPASLKKIRLLKNLPLCSDKFKFLILDRPKNNYVARKVLANDFSQVAIANEWLIPGDSPTKNERRWISQIAVPGKIKYLLLGHHGSRTSTSTDLLKHLPNLRVAISSSRFARYGHPHQEVRRRLREANVPLLLTEDWGSLLFAR